MGDGAHLFEVCGWITFLGVHRAPQGERKYSNDHRSFDTTPVALHDRTHYKGLHVHPLSTELQCLLVGCSSISGTSIPRLLATMIASAHNELYVGTPPAKPRQQDQIRRAGRHHPTGSILLRSSLDVPLQVLNARPPSAQNNSKCSVPRYSKSILSLGKQRCGRFLVTVPVREIYAAGFFSVRIIESPRRCCGHELPDTD